MIDVSAQRAPARRLDRAAPLDQGAEYGRVERQRPLRPWPWPGSRLLRQIAHRLPPHGTGAIILMYHQIAELQDDRWSLAVSPRNFDEQLQVIAQLRRPVSLTRLTDELGSGRVDPLLVAITFDDGYLDNLTNAKPILERHGIPATTFVVGDTVGKNREFWWDELSRLLLGGHPLPETLHLRISERDHRWNLLAPGNPRRLFARRKWSPERLHQMLWRRLRALPGPERWEVVDTLRLWAGQPIAVRPDRQVMTAAEVRQLHHDGLIEIGAHTASHPRLSALSEAEQIDEITRGKTGLEDILDAPVTSFSYPFGGEFDVPDASVDAVRTAGFARACTTSRGAVRPTTNVFRLPRLYVDDWSGDELQQRLAPWFKAR